MILIHLLLGIIFGQVFGGMIFFILGSLLPDLDHFFVIVRHRNLGIRKLIDSIRYEKRYDIKYKTPLFHSFLALIVFSSAIFLIFGEVWIYFSIAYLLHLLIDWVDVDVKYYLWPLKVEFKGFLPIWSKFEWLLTLTLLIVIFVLYLLGV